MKKNITSTVARVFFESSYKWGLWFSPLKHALRNWRPAANWFFHLCSTFEWANELYTPRDAPKLVLNFPTETPSRLHATRLEQGKGWRIAHCFCAKRLRSRLVKVLRNVVRLGSLLDWSARGTCLLQEGGNREPGIDIERRSISNFLTVLIFGHFHDRSNHLVYCCNDL